MDTFKFGDPAVKKQRDQTRGDAKELINGEPLDSDDGGPLDSAKDTADGTNAPKKGVTFNP